MMARLFSVANLLQVECFCSTVGANTVTTVLMKEGGFFVECGALTGELLSNTAWLERQRRWQGLLIEMDPFFYTQLLGKNRRVWSINACLSPYNYFTTVGYNHTSDSFCTLLHCLHCLASACAV